MAENAPVIWWIRRDLRLADNPALIAAIETGAPLIPLYILDPQDEALGAAPKFRLGLGLAQFSKNLEALGSRLILRRGAALDVLRDVIRECGVCQIVWSRLYDPEARSRDSAIKGALKSDGIKARSTGGRLLFEPWTVENKSAQMFKVYTPFWKTVCTRVPSALTSPPTRLAVPQSWPRSDVLEDYNMGASMHRGGFVTGRYCRVGEEAALDHLDWFLAERVDRYKTDRDFPALDATSGMSENLAWGEISPHRLWHLGQQALTEGKRGAEHFVKEVVWREFAYHLMFHTPHILTRNWRSEWDDFAWDSTEDEKFVRWTQGQTGYDLVDAAMRELYVTGKMHNRARMVVASFLSKHLMKHWKLGLKWFEDCLVDWDPASNAMGWQWVAGCGPDAAPFFRIFNPDGQRDKFDPDGFYTRLWIAEGQRSPPSQALDFFEAIPPHWQLSAELMRATPMIDLKEGRRRALDAYAVRKKAS